MYSLGLIHIANHFPFCESYLKLPLRCTDVQEASLKTLGLVAEPLLKKLLPQGSIFLQHAVAYKKRSECRLNF